MKTPKDKLTNLATRGDARRLLNESQQQESERAEFKAENIPTEHPIWDLWQYLSGYYGAAFTSQYGDDPDPVWLYELRDLTPADYRVGIERLKFHESSFAPNPGEFIGLVHGGATAQERASHVEWQPAGLLEDEKAKAKKQEATKEVASHLRDMLDNWQQNNSNNP